MFWLWAPSSIAVSFILNSLFISLFNLWPSKIPWYSTKILSIAYFSSSMISVSVQSNRSRSLLSVHLCLWGLVLLSFSVPSFKWRFVCVLGHDPQFCQSCQEWLNRICCFVVWIDWLVLSSSLSYVVRSRSLLGIILRIAVSTDLMNVDCFGVTTEISAIFVFFLIVQGDSVVLVTLTATSLSNIVKI